MSTEKELVEYSFEVVLKQSVMDNNKVFNDPVLRNGMPGVCNGEPYIDFDIESSSFLAAVLSALHAIDANGIGPVLQVQTSNLLYAEELHERLIPTSAEGFPAPINPGCQNLMWSWLDVDHWCRHHMIGYAPDDKAAEQRRVLIELNTELSREQEK